MKILNGTHRQRKREGQTESVKKGKTDREREKERKELNKEKSERERETGIVVHHQVYSPQQKNILEGPIENRVKRKYIIYSGSLFLRFGLGKPQKNPPPLVRPLFLRQKEKEKELFLKL